jgi:tetratricopeptide (TPR) repeat protein
LRDDNEYNHNNRESNNELIVI